VVEFAGNTIFIALLRNILTCQQPSVINLILATMY